MQLQDLEKGNVIQETIKKLRALKQMINNPNQYSNLSNQVISCLGTNFIFEEGQKKKLIELIDNEIKQKEEEFKNI